ncbi:Speckle-type POZ [Fusarium albosuccineum]|uniref:Speckle-type POZ n=1 Tax=Fusarium albosuccineum TaxID=1237068 RepID=A0A8H4L447_9HYPO|nr:Speckle-type POZ [Fusarium albosuccineum]
MIPAVYAREAFSEALNSLYSAGAYSDLTIKCGNKRHRVHKALVCTRSPFFAKACSGPFKESQTNVIDLVDDDPEAVDAMIFYLYHGHYPKVDPDAPRPQAYANKGWCLDWFGEDTIGLQEQYLPLHAKVYALAEKYQIPDLKKLATRNFNSTVDSDRGLRDLVVEAMYWNPLGLGSEIFKSVLQANPAMAYDIAIFHRERGI